MTDQQTECKGHKQADDVRGFETREPAAEVPAEVYGFLSQEAMRGEGQGQNEPADRKEQLDTSPSITHDRGAGIDVIQDDADDCDETKAVNFWDEAPGARNAGESPN
jgi:hypothetical protein